MDGRLDIHAWAPIEIGRSVIFNDEVVLMGASHKPDSPQFGGQREPIKIGDYAWLPMRIIVLPGVTIGHAAVIGSGAVVTKDVPDYGIAVGNPAKVVKERARLDFSYVPATGEWDRHAAPIDDAIPSI